jgi:hypothetical protein
VANSSFSPFSLSYLFPLPASPSSLSVSASAPTVGLKARGRTLSSLEVAEDYSKKADVRQSHLIDSARFSHIPASYYDGLPVKPGVHAFKWLLPHPSRHVHTERAKQRGGLKLRIPPALVFGEPGTPTAAQLFAKLALCTYFITLSPPPPSSPLTGTDDEFKYIYSNKQGYVESYAVEDELAAGASKLCNTLSSTYSFQSTPKAQNTKQLPQDAAMEAIMDKFAHDCVQQQFVLQPKQIPPPLHLKTGPTHGKWKKRGGSPKKKNRGGGAEKRKALQPKDDHVKSDVTSATNDAEAKDTRRTISFSTDDAEVKDTRRRTAVVPAMQPQQRYELCVVNKVLVEHGGRKGRGKAIHNRSLVMDLNGFEQLRRNPSSNSVIQGYVKCKGPRSVLYRYVWKANMPGYSLHPSPSPRH